MGFAESVVHINTKIPGTLRDLRDRTMQEFPHISTGSFVVDYVSGIGGIPRGGITELHGLQSSGKTTCALQTAAECQAKGEGVLYIDHEHSIDPKYAETLGVSLDPSKWAIMQPNCMEDGFRVAEYFMQQGGCGLIIEDSVAAMVPKSETEGEIGETVIGTQARAMSLALRQLKHLICISNTAFIFINQLRDVIDLSWAGQQRSKSGPQYTTPGGRALKFFADMRLEFMPTGQEKVEVEALFGKQEKEKVVIGQKARVTAVKNKCAAPYRSGEIFLRAGKGIDSTVPCVDLAVKFGLIHGGTGGRYKVPSPYCDPNFHEESVHGKETLYAYFEGYPDRLGNLFVHVWDKLQQQGG